MIIALYESGYPLETSGVPKWEDLPVGYFTADMQTVQQLIDKGRPGLFGGVFSVCRGKPRVGEHLLAVFGLRGARYVVNSTIGYRSEMDVVDSDEWNAELGFSDIVTSGTLAAFSR